MGMVWVETSSERGFKPVSGGFVYYPYGHLFRGYAVSKALHDQINEVQNRFLERFGMAAVFFLIVWPFLRRLFTPFPVPYNAFTGPIGLLGVTLLLLLRQQVQIHRVLKDCPVSDVPMTLEDRRRTVAASTSGGRLWGTIIGSAVMTTACLAVAIGSAVSGNVVMATLGTFSVVFFGWGLAEGIEVLHLKRNPHR